MVVSSRTGLRHESKFEREEIWLGKCKFAVDFGRFKITFIFMNLRGLKIMTDDEDYVVRGTLSRQAIPYLWLYIYNKTHSCEKTCTCSL